MNKLKGLPIALVILLCSSAAAFAQSTPTGQTPPGVWPPPLLIDATSSQVLERAHYTNRAIFVLYYEQGNIWCEREEARIQELFQDPVRRQWVELYKVEITRDYDCHDKGSHTFGTPTMVLLQRNSQGQVVYRNAALGYLPLDELYWFFRDGLDKPIEWPSCLTEGYVTETNFDGLIYEEEHSAVPVISLIYNGDSLLSQMAKQMFVEASLAYGAQFRFVAVNVATSANTSDRNLSLPQVNRFVHNSDGVPGGYTFSLCGFPDERMLAELIENKLTPAAP